MKLILLASVIPLFSSCIHTSKIQRPFTREVNLDAKHHIDSVPIEKVSQGNDDFHRAKAKELGIIYVDYLHMINSGKLKATKSEPVIYHKHR